MPLNRRITPTARVDALWPLVDQLLRDFADALRDDRPGGSVDTRLLYGAILQNITEAEAEARWSAAPVEDIPPA